MKYLMILIFLLLSGCTSAPLDIQTPGAYLNISELNPDKWTAMTRQNLEHFLQVYDLSPLLFTNKVIIQSRALNHAHPILTLNTNFAEHPQKLLASFIHEQFHWWAGKNQIQFRQVLKELRKIYPKKPENETYIHLAICYLEYEGLIFYLGKSSANKILNEFIAKDKLRPWIYSVVQKDYSNLKMIMKRNGLLPTPLT